MRFLGLAAAAALLATVPANAATVFGIDLSGRLVTFDSAAPGTITSTRTLTGVTGAAILGLDFRPATGELFALGGNGTLYTINGASGVATAVGSGGIPISGNNFGFDFNPTVDRIRLVSENGQNLRLNPITGGVAATDTPYVYASGAAAAISAVGYTNSVSGATTTTLYGIDYVANTLALIGSPNGGTISTVGALGFDVGVDASFDITPAGEAFLSSGTGFYRVNLTTGTATLIGQTGGLRSIAVGPGVPEPATWLTMILGFGLLGGLLRRRQSRPALA